MKEESGIKISVAIATYNGEKFIEEQLYSILNQTQPPDEIIISDDGSTDSTREIAEKVLSGGGIKFRVIRNTGKRGVNGNFENAIKNCTGDLIFLSDQDDVWEKERIETALKMLSSEENDRKSFFFSDAVITDENLSPTGRTIWGINGFDEKERKKFRESPEYQFFALVKRNFIPGMTMAFWRESAGIFLPFPDEWHHDHWMAVILSAIGYKGLFSEKPLVLYRQHSQQATGVRRVVRLPHRAFARKCRQMLVLFRRLMKLEREGIPLIFSDPLYLVFLKSCLLRLSNI